MKKFSEKSERVIRSILSAVGNEIPVELDEPGAAIYFRASHLYDLRTILSSQEGIKDDAEVASDEGATLSTPPNEMHYEFRDKIETEPQILYKRKSTTEKTSVEKKSVQYVRCPKCHPNSGSIRSDRIKRHMQKVHGIETNDIDSIENMPTKDSHPPKKNKKEVVKRSSAWRPGKCRSCGAPAIPGSDYCYSCG
ncbi:MAG: hypothetical protein U5R49_12835 [Deltaproteobacteria bacterium]|nr:hypothetical protein [Deltaproteobacteria bacterium]